MRRDAQRLRGKRRGAIIVEFALVVPFMFLIVFGIIDFSRAYAQLNNLNSSLREGARYGAAQKVRNLSEIRKEVDRFSKTWANAIDTNYVQCNPADCGTDNAAVLNVEVYVTNYPITLPTLGGFLKIAGKKVTVSRRVSYRWERSCPIGGGPGCT
jgi:Flp pilus assembly protein TadG